MDTALRLRRVVIKSGTSGDYTPGGRRDGHFTNPRRKRSRLLPETARNVWQRTRAPVRWPDDFRAFWNLNLTAVSAGGLPRPARSGPVRTSGRDAARAAASESLPPVPRCVERAARLRTVGDIVGPLHHVIANRVQPDEVGIELLHMRVECLGFRGPVKSEQAAVHRVLHAAVEGRLRGGLAKQRFGGRGPPLLEFQITVSPRASRRGRDIPSEGRREVSPASSGRASRR